MIIAQDSEVVIRDLEAADIPLLARYANNEKVSMNLRDAFPNPYTEEDARKFLNMVEQQEPRTIFAIEFQGQYAGNISVTPGTDVYRKSAEIGYFIGEPFWNKGIMTRAVRLITQYGFEHFDIVRIHTGVFAYNLASQRVLEKCGFVKEGVFKNAICKTGGIHDEVRYALFRK